MRARPVSEESKVSFGSRSGHRVRSAEWPRFTICRYSAPSKIVAKRKEFSSSAVSKLVACYSSSSSPPTACVAVADGAALRPAS